MKILVTGGTGFIGSHVVEKYLKAGYEVVVVDNLSTGKRKYIPKAVRLYNSDIRDIEKIEEIIKKERPEIINHHAAQKNVRFSTEKPIEDADINIIGSLNLLNATVKFKVKRLIFASTGGAIYGKCDNIPTPENEPAQPPSPYGIAKLTIENYLRFYRDNHNLKYVILRYANVYGPRQDPKGEAGVIAIFIQKLLRGEQPVIYGRGAQTRDFVYVDDVAAANLSAIENGEGEIINIGTGSELSINKLYEAVLRVMKLKARVKYEPARAGEVLRSCLAIAKAQKILHFRPKTSLNEGLDETITFLKSGI